MNLARGRIALHGADENDPDAWVGALAETRMMLDIRALRRALLGS